jgi:uncharacterized protein (TIGR02448 family)
MKSVLLAILTLSSLQALASDDNLWSTTAPFVLSSAFSTSMTHSRECGSWSCNDKIIVAAKDDAANFIASGGAVRGLNFQTALEYIRTSQPEMRASDQELAEAIINF